MFFQAKLKIQVSLKGAPNDDKTLTVEVELHALDGVLEGAAEGYMRLYSSADTFIDFLFTHMMVILFQRD